MLVEEVVPSVASRVVPFDRLRVTGQLDQFKRISYLPVSLSLSKGNQREATPPTISSTNVISHYSRVSHDQSTLIKQEPIDAEAEAALNLREAGRDVITRPE